MSCLLLAHYACMKFSRLHLWRCSQLSHQHGDCSCPASNTPSSIDQQHNPCAPHTSTVTHAHYTTQVTHTKTCAAPCQLLQLASGEVYGKDQPIALQLLGSDRSRQALEGVAMELEDSLYPLLREVGWLVVGWLVAPGLFEGAMPVILLQRACRVLIEASTR